MGHTRLAVAAIAAALVAFALAGASGGAVGDPPLPVTTGLQLWFEAETNADADGAPVTSWSDKSGFARDLSVTSPTQPPQMRRGAVNGRAAVEFGGLNQMMKTYSKTFTIAQPDTIFIVYKSLDNDTNPNRTYVYDSRNSSVRQTLGRSSAGTMRIYANHELNASGITYPFPSFQIVSAQYNGTKSDLHANGAGIAAGNAGASGISGFTLGGLSTSNGAGYDFGHELVAEVLVYQGAMSDVNRRATLDWLDAKYDLLPAGAPPVNVTPPSAEGTPNDNSPLTAAVGDWTGKSPMSFAYQWQLCDATPTCTDIAGATGQTYAPTLADTGSTARVIVTATNPFGTAVATSPQTTAIQGTPPSVVTPPTIVGSPVQGNTLTANSGTWAGDPTITFSYRWRRCNSVGASCSQVGTAGTYTLGAIDVFSVIQLAVTATNQTKAVTAPNVNSTQVQPATPIDTSAPPVATNLQLWYDASQETYANGEQVTVFKDRSGNARNLTPAVPAAAPIFKRDVVSGQPAVEFDGIVDLLKTYGSTFSLAQPDTFFIVYKALNPDTTIARTFVFDSTDSSVRQVFGRPAAGTVRLYANNDLDLPGITYPFKSFELWSGILDDGNSMLTRNNGLVGTGNAGTSNLSGFTLGGLSTDGTGGYDFGKSQIATVLYYSARLTPEQRQTVIAWLDGRYHVIQTPVNTQLPTISGTTADGSTMTAEPGQWGGAQPIGFAYKWQRCNNAGAACANIGAATAATYRLVTADVGNTVRVVVTGSNGFGSASANSAPSAVVAAGPPHNLTPPVITGTLTQGKTLTAGNGTWSGTGPFTFAYQWQRCDSIGSNCVNLDTANKLVLGVLDVGGRIQVTVSATNSLGSDSATSALSAQVASSAVADAQPPVTAGLALWVNAATAAYADGEAVTRWPDASGLGRDLTSDPNDPRSATTLRRNAINGRPALEFDGINSLLKTYGSSFVLPQPDTFFVVYKNLDAPTTEGWLFDSTNSLTRQLFGHTAAGNVELYANLPVAVGGITFPFTGYEVWSGTYNGASSSVWRKAAGQPVQQFAGNAGLSPQDGISIGGANSGGTAGYNRSHVLVAEVLWYAAPLSDADRTTVLNYLAGKYRIT